jgi:hypothetical protein
MIRESKKVLLCFKFKKIIKSKNVSLGFKFTTTTTKIIESLRILHWDLN